ncbi:MAG: hypothetical protein ABEJ36_04805 [Candidatus Nanosalina sp.]
MAVKKGQFLLTGLVFIGLILVTLSFTVLDFSRGEPGRLIYNDIEEAVPNQVEQLSREYSGESLLENFQAFTFTHRDRVTASGNSLGYTAVVGERSGRKFKVYVGNFRDSSQSFTVEVNGNSTSFTVASDDIRELGYPASGNYAVNVTGERFSKQLDVRDGRFALVFYRYENEKSVRQDTYIG